MLDSFYNDYFTACYHLVRSRVFTFMGHPDSIKLFNIYPSYDLKLYYKALAILLSLYNLETENNTKLHYTNKTIDIGLNKDLLFYLNYYNVKIHKSSVVHIYTDVGREFNLIYKGIFI